MKTWYVGHKRKTHGRLIAFSTSTTPSEETHGKEFFAVTGPMSQRAALWAEKYGYNNPHFQTTSDAERLSKIDNEEYDRNDMGYEGHIDRRGY